MKNIKAQGISLNAIIIAALALLVLVVLSVIFMGRMADFGGAVSSCENKGGTCAFESDGCGEGKREYTAWKCPDIDEVENEICCIAIE